MIDFLNKSDIFLKTLFNVSLDSISPDFTNLSSVNEKIKDFPQFTEQIKVFIAKIIEFRDEQRQLKHVFQLNLAKKYIKDSCHSHELNLESIAKVSGMSPAHFSTIFRQEVGITYIEYLTDIRIEEAKRLLSETRMRSSDIAYEVEYTDPQYFSYLFRKKTGMSPTEYRKTHTEEL
jgi:two-component system response regulator YesN